jgi:hypothetical protein
MDATTFGHPIKGPRSMSGTSWAGMSCIIGQLDFGADKEVTQLASGLLVIAFAAAMMGIGHLYIEKRSAKFSVFPAAQAQSQTVGLSRSQRPR